MIYIVFDKQKALKNTLKATTFKVEENSKTLKRLAQQFKDFPRTSLKFKDFSRLCEPCRYYSRPKRNLRQR